MIHFSCDRCKRELDPEVDLRYVVRLEVSAVVDASPEETDDDRDHLLEIHEILERCTDLDDEMVGDDVYQKLRFDLCSECYRKYIRSPLGREPAEMFGFSEN
jgi:hypothetical protein